MHINMTFVIQICNFLITYKVLYHLLFKPVIVSIEEKKEKEKTIKKSIEQKEAELLDLEKQKVENVIAFQSRAKEQYPFETFKKDEKPLEVDTKGAGKPADPKRLEKKIKEWIVSKVPHGY